VLPGFGTRHQVLLGAGIRADRVDEARRWLGALVPMVSTLRQVNEFRELRRTTLRLGVAPPSSPVWTNLAFDAKGVALLAPDASRVRDARFGQGMGASSGLGDPRDPTHAGHPARWVVGGTPEKTPEVLAVLGCDDLDVLRRHAADVRTSAEAAGLVVAYAQEGHVLEGDVEHFGFRDGISSPGARGRLSDAHGHLLTRRYIDPADERSRRFGRPGQPLVWPGQFVFGYPRQRADDPLRPGPVSDGGHDWMHDGSFLVFRRLRQDVAAFRRFVDEEAGRLDVPGMTPDRLAALLVGRWPRGTAVVRNPSGDDPDPMADRLAVNHFGFADATEPVTVSDGPARTVPGAPGDRLGRVCPGFAHIRKVNPRDLPTDKGGPDRTLTFAVLRRGIPWGQPYPDDPAAREADDGDRGLLFLCCQTSIKDQFEVLNSDWMNRVNGPEGEAGHDLLVGQGPGAARERSARLRSAQEGGEPLPIVTLSEWVVPTGGGYFFAPSVATLRRFARPT
jgi:Dyp-type peroxidase family